MGSVIVGSTVGTPVLMGAPDGRWVGSTTGAAVGSSVGEEVGDTVGDDVIGVWVGVAVGGLNEGVFDGESVKGGKVGLGDIGGSPAGALVGSTVGGILKLPADLSSML